MKSAWKFLLLKDGEIVSQRDSSKWIIGSERSVPPPTEECKGLNCSVLIRDALSFVQGDVLALVQYDGKIIESSDKLTCERMTIKRAWKWDKIASVRMATISARMVLGIYEEKYPDDSRPRKAIEAAEDYIKNPAESAWSAAWSAWSAWSAAWSAARSAARSAAWSAARKKMARTINKKIVSEIIPTLEEIKGDKK